MARAYAETIPYLENKVLDDVAKEIKDDIHADYYLADIIKKVLPITLDICLYISEQKLKNFIGIDILNQFSAPLLLLKALICPLTILLY